MKMDEILDLIRQLACSQGMYGRLYRNIMVLKENDEEGYNELVKEWEGKNFTDDLDFILWFEGGE